MSPKRARVRPPPNRRKVVRPPPLVLIVENHGDTRKMYAESLAFNVLRVIESMTAADAFKKAHTYCPDVITTDIALSGGTDGCALTEQLKSDPRTKRIPVIAVTAWAIGGQVERAHEAGCDLVLVKPVLPQTLLAEIFRLLHLEPSTLNTVNVLGGARWIRSRPPFETSR